MRILVFQHVAVEHPGIFREFLKEDGIPWDAVELDAGERCMSLGGSRIALVVFSEVLSVGL